MKSKYKQMWVGARKVDEHILVAEKALGRSLPSGAEVHHVDGNGHNNAPENLVICPGQAYHQLLHMRQRALDTCGNANWVKCAYCLQYDDPKNLRINPYFSKTENRMKSNVFHVACRKEYRRRNWRKHTKKEPSHAN